MMKIRLNLNELVKKYSPEQIRGFLGDISNAETLPQAARDAAKKLLERYNAGQSLKGAIKSETKGMIKDARKNLEDRAKDLNNPAGNDR